MTLVTSCLISYLDCFPNPHIRSLQFMKPLLYLGNRKHKVSYRLVHVEHTVAAGNQYSTVWSQFCPIARYIQDVQMSKMGLAKTGNVFFSLWIFIQRKPEHQLLSTVAYRFVPPFRETIQYRGTSCYF